MRRLTYTVGGTPTPKVKLKDLVDRLGDYETALATSPDECLSPEEVGELLAIGNQGGKKVIEAEREANALREREREMEAVLEVVKRGRAQIGELAMEGAQKDGEAIAALTAELLAAREEVARLEAYTDYKNMRYTTENAPDRLQVPRPVWERLNCENASLTAEIDALKEREKGFYRMINGSLEREKAVEAERDELKDWKREAREVAVEAANVICVMQMGLCEDVETYNRRLELINRLRALPEPPEDTDA